MQRINTDTAEQDKFGVGKDGFREGNPLEGVLATRLSAAWFDSLQEETAAVVEFVGRPLLPNDNTQLLRAVLAMSRSVAASNWRVAPPTSAYTLNAIAYGAGKWVVAESGSPKLSVFASPVSGLWANHSIGVVINAIAHNGALWVAVGAGGGVVTSPDGSTWTSRGTTAVGDFNGVAWGDGLWVAVTTDGEVFTSTDGVTWTAQLSDSVEALYAVAWAGGRWVVVGSETIQTSLDGETWVRDYSLAIAQEWKGVTFVQGRWVAVSAAGETATSEDGGVTWQGHAAVFDWTCRGLAVDPQSGLVIAFGAASLAGRMALSTDGLRWTQVHDADLFDPISCLGFSPTQWLAGAVGGDDSALYLSLAFL